MPKAVRGGGVRAGEAKSRLQGDQVGGECEGGGGVGSHRLDPSDNNPAGRMELGGLMAVTGFDQSIIQERVVAELWAVRVRDQTESLA